MKTTDEIYQEMCEAFQNISGFEVNDGCDMAVRLYAAAAQIYSLYVYNDWVKTQCFPQTATGESLDNHAQMRGLTRSPALKASGFIRFSIEEAVETDITIQAGTVCLTAAGDRFITTEEAVIEAGALYADAAAEAAEAGSAGNVSIGMIAFMAEAPVGVSSCTNIQRFTGGADAESDEELRERILSSFQKLPNGANAAYYEKQVLAMDGVAAVKVLPKKRGLGTVDIVPSEISGAHSEELLEAIQNRLDELREICVDINVTAPETVAVNIEASLDLESGHDFETVKTAAQTALESYFNGEVLGCDILKAKLGDILFNLDGVKNYSIQMPAGDLSIGDTQLPILGTLTINSWS